VADDYAIDLRNRPDTVTKRKNGDDGERWVYLGPSWFRAVDDYTGRQRV
jgi:hypothetical protein